MACKATTLLLFLKTSFKLFVSFVTGGGDTVQFPTFHHFQAPFELLW